MVEMGGVSGPQTISGAWGVGKVNLTFKPKQPRRFPLGFLLFIFGISIILFQRNWRDLKTRRNTIIPTLRYSLSLIDHLYQHSYNVFDNLHNSNIIIVTEDGKGKYSKLNWIGKIIEKNDENNNNNNNSNNKKTVISGNSNFATIYTQGYYHAYKRYHHMDIARRIADGRLSEIFGDVTLELDIYMRRMNLRSLAQSDAVRIRSSITTSSSPSELEYKYLDAYVRGVSGYLNTHPYMNWETYFLYWLNGVSLADYPLKYHYNNNDSSGSDESMLWTIEDTLVLMRLQALQYSHGWREELLQDFIHNCVNMNAEQAMKDLEGSSSSSSEESEGGINKFWSYFQKPKSIDDSIDDNNDKKMLPVQHTNQIGASTVLVSGKFIHKTKNNKKEEEEQEEEEVSHGSIYHTSTLPTGTGISWWIQNTIFTNTTNSHSTKTNTNDDEMGGETLGMAIDASGISVPGIPFLMSGHNGRVQWVFAVSPTVSEQLFTNKQQQQHQPKQEEDVEEKQYDILIVDDLTTSNDNTTTTTTIGGETTYRIHSTSSRTVDNLPVIGDLLQANLTKHLCPVSQRTCIQQNLFWLKYSNTTVASPSLYEDFSITLTGMIKMIMAIDVPSFLTAATTLHVPLVVSVVDVKGNIGQIDTTLPIIKQISSNNKRSSSSRLVDTIIDRVEGVAQTEALQEGMKQGYIVMNPSPGIIISSDQYSRSRLTELVSRAVQSSTTTITTDDDDAVCKDLDQCPTTTTTTVDNTNTKTIHVNQKDNTTNEMEFVSLETALAEALDDTFSPRGLRLARLVNATLALWLPLITTNTTTTNTNTTTTTTTTTKNSDDGSNFFNICDEILEDKDKLQNKYYTSTLVGDVAGGVSTTEVCRAFNLIQKLLNDFDGKYEDDSLLPQILEFAYARLVTEITRFASYATTPTTHETMTVPEGILPLSKESKIAVDGAVPFVFKASSKPVWHYDGLIKDIYDFISSSSSSGIENVWVKLALNRIRSLYTTTTTTTTSNNSNSSCCADSFQNGTDASLIASIVGGSVVWAFSKVQAIVRDDQHYLSLGIATLPRSSSSSFRDKSRGKYKKDDQSIIDDMKTLPRWSWYSSSSSSSSGRSRDRGMLGEITALYPSIVNFRSSKFNALHEILSIPNDKSHTKRSLGASDAIARYSPGGSTNFRRINELESNPSQGQGPTLFRYSTRTTDHHHNTQKFAADFELWP